MGSLSEQYNAQVAAEAEKQGLRILTPMNLAIAAAVAVVVVALVIAVPKLIPKSPEELYDADRTLVRETVLLSITGYSAKPIKYMSSNRYSDEEKDKYPTWARVSLGTRSALREADAGSDEITTLLMESHPGGSKEQGGTPVWQDGNGDGLRDPDNEKLFYHKASPEPTVDHWNTTPITLKGVDYVVDSRDWFIDFDYLVEKEFIEAVPESASPDNSVKGTGSYSWYVDENFQVKSVLYLQPTVDTDGFQGVFP